MKTKDIVPGVVYAHRAGQYGPVTPVVFLTAPKNDSLFSRRSGRVQTDAPLFFRATTHTRPKAARGYRGEDVGYPVVTIDAHRVRDTDPAALLTATMEEFVAAKYRTDEERGIAYTLVTNPASIQAPWEEFHAQERADLEAHQRYLAKVEARRRTHAERAEELVSALARHGVKARTGLQTGGSLADLQLSLEEVAGLVALLDERA